MRETMFGVGMTLVIGAALAAACTLAWLVIWFVLRTDALWELKALILSMVAMFVGASIAKIADEI